MNLASTRGVSPRLVCGALMLVLGLACACSPKQKYEAFLERGKAQLAKQDYRRAMLEFQNAIRLETKAAEARYLLALAYQGAKDSRSAAAALWKALELDPTYRAAELKLSELAIGTRDRAEIEQAEKRVRQLIDRAPSPEAFNVLATALSSMGKYNEAEKVLIQASARFPEDLKAVIGLAQLKLARKDLAGAETLLKGLAEKNPKLADAAVTLGRFYVMTGRLDDAAFEFHRALRLDPRSGPALAALADKEWRAGRVEQADSLYREAASLGTPEYKLLHATFLYRLGKWDQAIAEYEKLWKESPQDRDIRTLLVSAYQGANRPDEAVKALSASLSNNAKDVDALFQRSQIFVSEGKYGEAESDVMTVLRYRPDSASAHYMVGKVYHSMGADRRYREQLTEALRLQPDLLAARIDLADSLTTSKAAQAALEILKQTPKSQQNEIVVRVQENWAYLGMGDWAQAGKGIDALLQAGEMPEALIQSGVLKLTARDFAGARNLLERALKQRPDDYRALNLLLQAYDFQQQLPAGLERLRRHAAQWPNSPPVQYFLGQVLARMGQSQEARAAFAAALSADPKVRSAEVALAGLDAAEGKNEAARQRLSAVLARAPRDISARLMIGNIEEGLGNRIAAIEHYRKVVELDETNIDGLNRLAYILAESGKENCDEALKLAEKAKELSPQNPAAQSTLGWVLYRKGLPTLAIRYLEQAVTTEATGLRKAHLAAAYLGAGNQPKARDLLQAALKMDPALAQSDLIKEIKTSSNR